jgi:hypothetical protein
MAGGTPDWQVTRYRTGTPLVLTRDDFLYIRTRGVATAAVGEFEAIFDDDITVGTDIQEEDGIVIEMGYVGAALTKVFCGSVEKISEQGRPPNTDVRIWGRDWGRLLKDYRFSQDYRESGEYPEDIVEDIVASINDYPSTPTVEERKIYFDKTQWTGSPLIYVAINDMTLFDAIQSICYHEDVQREFYVDPDKTLNFPVKGHGASVETLDEEELDSYDHDKDAQRKRTRVLFLGANTKIRPDPQYDWTDSTTGWTMVYGDTLTTVPDHLGTANKAIKIETTSADAEVRGDIAFSAEDLTELYTYNRLKTYVKVTRGGTTNHDAYIILLAPDWDNSFFRWLDPINTNDKWFNLEMEIGEEYEGYPFWYTFQGSPYWNNIQGIGFRVDWKDNDTFAIHISNVHMAGARYNYEKKAPGWTTATDIYGVQWDFTMQSDAEAQQNAEDFINKYGDVLTILKNITIIDGRQTYEQSYKLTINTAEVPTSTYRMEEVEHIMDGNEFTTNVVLGEASLGTEHILADMEREIKRLERERNRYE